jgi:hypothetical protein
MILEFSHELEGTKAHDLFFSSRHPNQACLDEMMRVLTIFEPEIVSEIFRFSARVIATGTERMIRKNYWVFGLEKGFKVGRIAFQNQTFFFRSAPNNSIAHEIQVALNLPLEGVCKRKEAGTTMFTMRGENGWINLSSQKKWFFSQEFHVITVKKENLLRGGDGRINILLLKNC